MCDKTKKLHAIRMQLCCGFIARVGAAWCRRLVDLEVVEKHDSTQVYTVFCDHIEVKLNE